MQLADIFMKIKTLQTKIRHLNAKSEIRSNNIVMYNTKIGIFNLTVLLNNLCFQRLIINW